MNVFAGIAACFHTVKTFSNFEPNYVRLIGPFNANACFAFIKRSHTVFFTTLERSTDVVRQRNGNFFMMKTVHHTFHMRLAQLDLGYITYLEVKFFTLLCLQSKISHQDNNHGFNYDCMQLHSL